jgi:hypothetical protein
MLYALLISNTGISDSHVTVYLTEIYR